MTRHANRLLSETSPYLQQHAHNPVDWYPWGEEALARARAEDKPILLSIGYSACHWCHVMAHESFENEAIAAAMNEHFVNIKVDREERPDLDQIYQTVCQLLTRAGGWPLTVFLTPDQEPFFAGTYFPPEQRYGRPGFREVLLALADAYREARSQVADQARQILQALHELQSGDGHSDPPDRDLLAHAHRVLAANFDRRNGGFGTAPKFPNPFNLEVFLRHYAASGEQEALEDVVRACRHMRAGGVYDQLGHGFHRYSVDAEWRVPHFEKMLYDNVLLPPVYLSAWLASELVDLAATARETLDYLLAEMRHPEGGFYSTTDADSEGEEGRYFAWTPDQVREVLEATAAELACERFGISPHGNFEHGTSVPSLARSLEELAAARGWPPQQAADAAEQARRELLAARAQRVAPFRDEKVLTAWNGLAIRAFAQAGLVLGEPRYLKAAAEAAEFVLARLADGDRLHRVYHDGRRTAAACLDDYGALIAGLLELFGASGEPRWFERAAAFAETALAEFGDDDVGDFFMTPAGGERLVLRPKDIHDSATPSGLSLMVGDLVRLYEFTGDDRYRARAEQAAAAHGRDMRRNAWGMANLIVAADGLRTEPESLVIAGAGPAADALLRVALSEYRPRLLLARRPAEVPDEHLPALLHHRGLVDGRPAAWHCRGFTCRAPITDPVALTAALAD